MARVAEQKVASVITIGAVGVTSQCIRDGGSGKVCRIFCKMQRLDE